MLVCVVFRVTLLELLFAQLREEDSEQCSIPPSVAQFLASSFQKCCGAVLTLATGSASSDEVKTDKLNLWDKLPLMFPYCISHMPASCWVQSPAGPAGGTDSDQSAGCAV